MIPCNVVKTEHTVVNLNIIQMQVSFECIKLIFQVR